MKNKLKQFLCGIRTGHVLSDLDRECKYDETDETFIIKETCCKCGKKFSFKAHKSKFGL